ncbi:unnamed protein product [Spirodela intermedia]|uniref:serine C-palmitoyltransferase n=1 Tax=Spirodela intermedia TaxID=51605 RepID=A0A7I8KB43_SPIIN|nr:unnamed protein product [Spirodela intermedia]
MWEDLVLRSIAKIDRNDFLRYFPLVCLPKVGPSEDPLAGLETFDGPGPWDRTLLEIEVENPMDLAAGRKKMLVFSGNDYLNLSSHPAVRQAAAKAALAYGMGPRASSLITGHTDYHRLLESNLAEMHKKEACIITPTGFAANTAFLSALGSIASLTSAGRRPAKHEKIAIFSDGLNHASIIDGLRMVDRHQEADVIVYRHNDMGHLDELLSNSPAERKLVQLRKKHGFLFVIDDAHTTLVCGKHGGGITEVYGIEDQIDICVGSLSKATGCMGGFIACSKNWKKLIQGKGRPYIFSTASPLPVVAGCCAAVMVAKKESWRREAVWRRVQEFSAMTGHQVSSPIISLVVGTEEAALRASKHMLDCGFHLTAIRPPAVAPDACRLRLTLTASHTTEDIRRLVAALSQCIHSFPVTTDHIAAGLQFPKL